MAFKRTNETFLETENIVSKKIKMTTVQKVFIYCRVSTKEQSLESQQYSCEKFCQERNYIVTDVIREACSARKMKNQPKLLKCLKENINTTIIVNSVDRFSRNVRECFKMCDIMKKNNINLISVTDQIDLSTAYGQHAFRTRVSTAQLESDMISERTLRTIQYKRERGLSLTTRAKYGYKIVNGIQVIDSNEQAVIHFVNKLMYRRISCTEFSQQLYELLNVFNKPHDYYVPVVFEEDNVRVQLITIIPESMAYILNDYDIIRRKNQWTASSIRNIHSLTNLSMNFTL